MNRTFHLFVQSSNDGFLFYDLAEENSRSGISNYSYSAKAAAPGKSLYRLKIVLSNGAILYSPILNLHVEASSSEFTAQVKSRRHVYVSTPAATTLKMYNSFGNLVGTYSMIRGTHSFDMQHLSAGVYIFRDERSGSSQKILLN